MRHIRRGCLNLIPVLKDTLVGALEFRGIAQLQVDRIAFDQFLRDLRNILPDSGCLFVSGGNYNVFQQVSASSRDKLLKR